MEYLYVLVVLLLVLGIADLVVGISNDAVNFLYSAIGSRVAKFKAIYLIAGAGLIIGTIFSGGMMEVARKSIFYPENLYLSQLLILFLAVMITDIILVDLFNTFGFPTSTTIAIVFELLGGALALGLIIIGGDNPDKLNISHLINTQRVFLILTGIVISIVLAFISGSTIQFLARLVFTFRYKERFRFLFSLAGAISLTSILFLLLKKDIWLADFIYKLLHIGADFNLIIILSLFFAITFSLFIVLALIFKVDIPKIVVLCGTFALALSFAANDLVNFIGVPLAALEGFVSFKQSGVSDSSQFLMNIWEGGVLNTKLFATNWYNCIYIFAGIIMVVTMFYSKKARTVMNTELYLGRQDAGYENFEPSAMSRLMVRAFLLAYKGIISKAPKKMVARFSNRYKRYDDNRYSESEEIIYFDTVRGSVNLVVSSILITIGTYFKFPLSTTFVVFMVAMGTSLSDQAWGRDSAVYRISGVLSVLGGWFITASVGFVGAFIITVFIWWAEIYAIIILVMMLCLIIYQTNKIHKKARLQRKAIKAAYKRQVNNDIENLVDSGSERIRKHIIETLKIYILAIQGFVDENTRQLKETCEKAKYLEKVSRSIKEELFESFSGSKNSTFDSGHYFIQAIDYLGELSQTLRRIADPVFTHVENQHKGLSPSQKEDALFLLEEVAGFFNYLIHIEKEQRFNAVPEMIEKQEVLLDIIEDLRRKQLKRIMVGVGKTKSSMLLLECYAESKNLVLYTINLLKSHRDFYQERAK